MDERVIEQLKSATANAEAGEAQSSSLLMQIRQKELEISGKVLEAKKKAEGIVAEARKKAAVIVQEADEKGITQAQEFYKKEMSEANAQAKEIEASTVNKVADIEKAGEKRIDEAVSYIVNQVMPKAE